jgi:hypothetical protein
VSDAEGYLRDLRRALPVGCRRRFVAEVREHFESAVAAEAERGVGRADAERLTIERLGPAHVLAEQLLADMRSGVLGPVARLSAALTVTRIALAAVLALAVVVGVAVVSVRSSSKTPPPTVQRAPDAGVVHNGVLVRRLVLTLSTAVRQRGKRRALPSGYVVVPRVYYTQSR